MTDLREIDISLQALVSVRLLLSRITPTVTLTDNLGRRRYTHTSTTYTAMHTTEDRS